MKLTHEDFLKKTARDIKSAIYAQDWSRAAMLTRALADSLVGSGKADGTPLEWLYEAK